MRKIKYYKYEVIELIDNELKKVGMSLDETRLNMRLNQLSNYINVKTIKQFAKEVA